MSNPIALSVQSQSPIVLEMGFNFVAPSGGGAGVGTISEDYEIIAAFPFVLQGVAIQPNLSKLFINGVRYRYGLHYNINGAIVNWFGIAINPLWEIEIFYYR